MRLAAVLVLVLPSIAAAQAPGMYDPTPPLAPPGMTPYVGDTDEPPRVVTPVAAPRTSLELAAARDAADDRAYGTSTALVVPDGKVDVSLRVAPIGGIASVTAGLGGGIEISADAGGLVVGEDGASVYGGGIKLALARRGSWALAVEGSYHKGGDTGESVSTGLWGLGAVVSGCTDHACSALISLGGGMLGTRDADPSAMPYAWGSALLGTGGFRPIIEAAWLGDGVIGFLGARMGGPRVAVDAGIGFVGGGGAGGGLPVIALSVRP